MCRPPWNIISAGSHDEPESTVKVIPTLQLIVVCAKSEDVAADYEGRHGTMQFRSISLPLNTLRSASLPNEQDYLPASFGGAVQMRAFRSASGSGGPVLILTIPVRRSWSS